MAETGDKKPHRPIPRPLVWIWAVIWPVLGLGFAAFGHEIAARFVPGAVDVAGDKVGLRPINLRHEWPGGVCNGSDLGAYPQPAPPLQGILKKRTTDDWVQTVVDAGGSAYRYGLLTLYISAVPNATVIVEGLEVLVHAHDTRPLAWAIAPDTECGGGDTDSRTYSLKVDAPNPQLHLLSVNGGKRPKTSAFTPFEASAGDPTQVLVETVTCSGNYEWGLRINYSVSGRAYSVDIGPAEAPLRLSGGPLASDTVVMAETYNDDGSSTWKKGDRSVFAADGSAC